ncbi:prolyl 4-hydroxylase alpha subunit-like protein [Skeletonema marinoi]|uniref:Prolyl 4-hydroxylase alpha subunit-like protein n=1 Tax=Skeletonema marinoi TaxID=267567 RepID=A0AAD8XVC9_9STRA|nr:prolyl 4-hydroxylase alpha subunit-like protein [Skeletonema marinoi]
MANLTVICYLITIALLSSNVLLTAQALATPAARRKAAQKAKKSSSNGGFAKKPRPAAAAIAAPQTQQPTTNNVQYDDAQDEVAKRAVSSLFSVCAHIQDPKLYQPKWADACVQQNSESGDGISPKIGAVMANRDVARGQVLTLFPIHALGLRMLRQNSDDEALKDTEFVAYDQNADGELFTTSEKAGLRLKLNIPLDKSQPAHSILGNKKRHVLFSMFLPEKQPKPGWLGGRMKAASSQYSESNCITVPLPGAAPLCAVVATTDVKEGEEIIQAMQPLKPSVMDELKGSVAKEYRRELATLQMYIEAACETVQQSSSQVDSSSGQQQQQQLGPFHQLNQKYPGLKRIHQDPDIYSIDNFLTNEECDRLIAKSQPHLVPCLVKNDKTGIAEQDPVRTSTNTNVPQSEVPSIVEKMTNVANCCADQLEILQVLNYKKGQEFIPHTDGFSGKFDACGFEQASRQATIFCYLNDVSEGGSTNFPEIGLAIQPKKGTAVIHFPADLELREDTRTLHQGAPAVDEKWLLTTWVWNRPRSDEMYAESRLPPLSSGDII